MQDDCTPYLYVLWETLSKDEIGAVRHLLNSPDGPLPTELEHRLGAILGCDPGEVSPATLRGRLLEFAQSLPTTCTVTVGPPLGTADARAEAEAAAFFGHRNFHWTRGSSAGKGHQRTYAEGPAR